MRGLLKNPLALIVLGIAIGVIAFMIIGSLSGSVKLIEDEKIVFKVADVYKDTTADFEGGTLPIYDEAFCKARFSVRYQKEASSCFIKSATGFARANPLIRDVECSCSE